MIQYKLVTSDVTVFLSIEIGHSAEKVSLTFISVFIYQSLILYVRLQQQSNRATDEKQISFNDHHFGRAGNKPTYMSMSMSYTKVSPGDCDLGDNTIIQ